MLRAFLVSLAFVFSVLSAKIALAQSVDILSTSIQHEIVTGSYVYHSDFNGNPAYRLDPVSSRYTNRPDLYLFYSQFGYWGVSTSLGANSFYARCDVTDNPELSGLLQCSGQWIYGIDSSVSPEIAVGTPDQVVVATPRIGRVFDDSYRRITVSENGAGGGLYPFDMLLLEVASDQAFTNTVLTRYYFVVKIDVVEGGTYSISNPHIFKHETTDWSPFYNTLSPVESDNNFGVSGSQMVPMISGVDGGHNSLLFEGNFIRLKTYFHSTGSHFSHVLSFNKDERARLTMHIDNDVCSADLPAEVAGRFMRVPGIPEDGAYHLTFTNGEPFYQNEHGYYLYYADGHWVVSQTAGQANGVMRLPVTEAHENPVYSEESWLVDGQACAAVTVTLGGDDDCAFDHDSDAHCNLEDTDDDNDGVTDVDDLCPMGIIGTGDAAHSGDSDGDGCDDTEDDYPEDNTRFKKDTSDTPKNTPAPNVGFGSFGAWYGQWHTVFILVLLVLSFRTKVSRRPS